MKIIRMTITDLNLITKSLPMGIIRRMQITYLIQDKKIRILFYK
jgi:hypothetical protein